MSSLSRKLRRKREKEERSVRNDILDRQEKLENMDRMMRAMNASKWVAMLVLRNQGWGKTRLERFNYKFDQIMSDISEGRLVPDDIPEVLEIEVGLKKLEITL